MPALLRFVFGLSIAALMIGVPLWYASYRERCFRNFHVVEEGVLYRSGQLNLAGLNQVLRDYGIKTVVSLRDGTKPADIEEEQFLAKKHVRFIRIHALRWSAPDGSVPAEKGLAEFRLVMQDPANYPILVHCLAGNHRTGAYCAICRMDFYGWSNEDAIQEMRHMGYRTLDGDLDVHLYLRNYRPKPPATPFRATSRTSSETP